MQSPSMVCHNVLVIWQLQEWVESVHLPLATAPGFIGTAWESIIPVYTLQSPVIELQVMK